SDGDLIEMGPLKLRLMDPEDKYLRDLEDPERAAERAAERGSRGESSSSSSKPPSKPVVVMPAALAVSLPAPSAFAPPPATTTPSGANAPPRKASRLAPRPSGPGPELPAAAIQARMKLDEHHPALAARRPPGDPLPQLDDQTEVRKAHKTMVFAAAVL